MTHASAKHRLLDTAFLERTADDGEEGGGGRALVASRNRLKDVHTMTDTKRGHRPANRPRVKLLELWEGTGAGTGKPYLSGFLGKLRVVGFREVRPHPKRPGEEVTVWSLYASEAEEFRREGG